ncbi:gastrotropin isoform X2 [Denticeps clupeoides]|uniref:gastrotropin isoform X2 n=1 Tax=Denticeps clupeoides TaxID=299321 RepID=UPI0010A55FAC|nr:gastrotropin isoform X2 [Denticeps clupeoides]
MNGGMNGWVWLSLLLQVVIPTVMHSLMTCGFHRDKGCGGIIKVYSTYGIRQTIMAFSGKYETETQEGYDAFCKLLGIPDDVIEKGRDYKLVTEVVQNGDEFSWTQHYPANHSVCNKFVIGKESDMQTIGGKKFKATVHMDGGKLSVQFPNYVHTSEIAAGKLVETSTASTASGPVVLKRTSKKL